MDLISGGMSPTVREYQALVPDADRFTYFTSDILVRAAKSSGDPLLREWASWYEELYYPPTITSSANL